MKMAWNGKITDAKEVSVSVMDHGFLYGMGLFETFRTYGGEAFLLQQHLERMQHSCSQLGIEVQLDEQQIKQLIAELLACNQLDDAYIRYSISAGEAPLGLPAEPYRQPQQFIYMKPLPPYNMVTELEGRTLQKLRLPRNTPEGAVRLKSFHYMNNILAKQELLSYPWCQDSEGLFFTEHGYAAEGIVSNLFILKEGRCCTPHLDTGILPGVTRAFVLQLAQQQGYQVEQGFYSFKELLQADELFMTNSIQEMIPVIQVYDELGEAYPVGSGHPGKGTLQLLEAYRNGAWGGEKP